MLNWKYFEKVWKYLSQSELWIYFLIFSLSGFWVWNFEIFPGSAISGLDLGYFQNFWHFSTRHLKLRNFFTQVLLELNFEIFLKFFQTQLTWTGLWNFFEIFSTWFDWSWTLKIFWKFSNLYWLCLNFEFFSWTCTHIWLNLHTTVELCWHLLTQLYCTWLTFPLQMFRHSIKNFSKHFIIW